MYRLTLKRIPPLERHALRNALGTLFPGAEERTEQSCAYTLRIAQPHIIIKQYTNGTLYIETESERDYETIASEIQRIRGTSLNAAESREAETGRSREPLIPEGITEWIGSDECGKGDYFGPLVTAAVLVDRETSRELSKLHVRDSKSIPDKQIEALTAHIRVICDGKYSVVTTMPERYNELFESASFKHNSARLLGWQHVKAIENIVKDHDEVVCALIDKFGDEKFVREYLTPVSRNLTIIFRHKAEENIAVAAASILAREEFLRRLSELEKKIGVPLPKGASDIVDGAAKKLVALKGENALRQVAKVHFKTTKKVLSGK